MEQNLEDNKFFDEMEKRIINNFEVTLIKFN